MRARSRRGRPYQLRQRVVRDPLRLLRDLLDGKVTLDALPTFVAVYLVTSDVLDTLLDHAPNERTAALLQSRYEVVFRHVVCGLIEDRLDGRLPRVPNGTWMGRTGAANGAIATRFLVEERLGWPVPGAFKRTDIGRDEDIRNRTRSLNRVFATHGLGGLLAMRYGGSPWRAVEAAYPGRLQRWELRAGPSYDWKGRQGRSHAVQATRWLIEERLAWNERQVQALLTRSTFKQHGLGGMLLCAFGDSLDRALEAAYPGRYTSDNTIALRRTRMDRLTRVLVQRLTALDEARRLGGDVAARRHRMTRQGVHLWIQAYEEHGIRGLSPRQAGRLGGVSLVLRRAIFDAGIQLPGASAQEVQAELAALGHSTSPFTIQAVWKAANLREVRRRLSLLAKAATYPSLQAAARALRSPSKMLYVYRSHLRKLGPFAPKLWSPRRVSPHTEWALLEAAVAHPTSTVEALRARLHAGGVRVSPTIAEATLARHGLLDPVARFLAGEGVPAELAWLEEVVPRRAAASGRDRRTSSA